MACARDPLAVVEAYKVHVCVRLAAALGVRMCPLCPRCNEGNLGCQDMFGNNMRPVGGVLGGMTALGGATEHQGHGTPHFHAEGHVVCPHQFGTLEDIVYVYVYGYVYGYVYVHVYVYVYVYVYVHVHAHVHVHVEAHAHVHVHVHVHVHMHVLLHVMVCELRYMGKLQRNATVCDLRYMGKVLAPSRTLRRSCVRAS